MHSLPLRAILGAVALALFARCSGKPPSCDDHFAGGAAPVLTNPALEKRVTTLCFEGYAVAFSGVSRTPLWSAEHLTADRVAQASRLKRKNNFHAEEKLPAADRSELADYARSGYDRGHMAPNGDMATEQAQYESFSLANIVPQNPKNNQILWEGIEEATRQMARDDNGIYVVTGPVFEGGELERINGRVLVPTAVYKAIYDPARHRAAAYLTPNAPGMAYQTLSIADLERRVGINLFPRLPAQIKASKAPLPVPTPHGHRRAAGGPVEVNPPERR